MTRVRRTQAERSASTKAALTEAAIAALYEHGYAATTTMLVAEQAGVSRGAMLHQFGTKHDLMTHVVESVYERELGDYAEAVAGLSEPTERLLAMCDAVWAVLSRPSGVAVLEILQGSRSDPVLAERLAPAQRQVDAIDDRHDPVLLPVGDLQALDLEQGLPHRRRRHQTRSRPSGLTASSSALPVRLNAIASKVTQTPGGTKYDHLPSTIAPES